MTLDKKIYNIEILTPASQHCLTLLYNLTIVIRHCNIDIMMIDLTLCEFDGSIDGLRMGSRSRRESERDESERARTEKEGNTASIAFLSTRQRVAFYYYEASIYNVYYLG
jgi:hypothetical protein